MFVKVISVSLSFSPPFGLSQLAVPLLLPSSQLASHRASASLHLPEDGMPCVLSDIFERVPDSVTLDLGFLSLVRLRAHVSTFLFLIRVCQADQPGREALRMPAAR